MITRISTGTTVQTTSSSVLWVVLDGTGLRSRGSGQHDDQQAEHEERDDRDDRHQQSRENVISSARSVAGACRPSPLSCGAPKTGAAS